MKAERRSVLVTGGAERIGRELCLGLAGQGWHVLIHYNRSEAPAQDLAGAISKMGGMADILQADFSRLEQVDELAENAAACAARRGARLAALVNNASRFQYDTLNSMSAEGFDAHIAVNLRAPLFLSRRAARLMQEAGGCIINILDNKIHAPNPDYFTYTVAKLALSAMTGSLALAVAPHVRVCGIAPGITLPSGVQSDADFEKAHKANPLHQGCTPAQLVDAVRFILDTPALTGQTIVIDGGQSLVNPGRDVAFIPL
ncbi:SDR family NAD(P)-dependent oxidoreductase [Xanthobacter sp. TB0139]|uniref:SDR family NAD(P)-dependent oxidoreductase n=1 Tax=Xanthobacter sp. TB0139 TaxID=3459178 RepID=UPI00403A5AB3